MGDKKLNEVTKVTDMAYVPVIMADGSIGQIAKADLASVVAGLLSLNNNSFFRVRGELASADSATDTGLYTYTGGTAINGSSYGLLLNICNIQFSVSWAWGAQIFFGDNNTISFRTSIRKNGVWGAWIAIG